MFKVNEFKSTRLWQFFSYIVWKRGVTMKYGAKFTRGLMLIVVGVGFGVAANADSFPQVQALYSLLNYGKQNNLGVLLRLANNQQHIKRLHGIYHSSSPYTNVELDTAPDENGVLVIPNPLPVPKHTQGIPSSGELTLTITQTVDGRELTQDFKFNFTFTNNNNKDYYRYQVGNYGDQQLQTLFVNALQVCANNVNCAYGL